MVHKGKMILGEELYGAFPKAIIYTMACHSLDTFGERMVAEGCRAYIGNDQIVWTAFNTATAPYRASDDFCKIWYNALLNLMRGCTVVDTVRDTRHAWWKLADHYDTIGNRQLAKDARFNGDHHGYVGCAECTLPITIHQTDLDLSAIPHSWEVADN